MSQPLWERFPSVVEKVRRDHRKYGALVGTGHDFAHALMVAQYCLLIAEGPLASLAWLAAICHNTDRMFDESLINRCWRWLCKLPLAGGLFRKADPAFQQWNRRQIERRVAYYLEDVELFFADKCTIIEAVLNHSRRPSDEDNEVTRILMDADKLANIGALLGLRSAQFQPNLPVIDLRYLDQRPPDTSFRSPGSIYWDIKSSLEWAEPGWIRTAKAQELAKPLFAELQALLDGLVRQFKDTGLLPYPFPEDFQGK